MTVRSVPAAHGVEYGPTCSGGGRESSTRAGAWEVKPRPAATSAFSVGERVFHQKFGYGRVTAIEENRLDIAFEKAGDKRLLDSFVEKT